MAGRSSDVDLVGGLGAVSRLGVVANLSDAQLLDHFLARQGGVAEAAFEALVVRHGPMVLDVCRSVLRDPHDAQDAFQATFLVLASRAGSIRQRETIAGWLLGVARRVSLRSRGDLARQRAREGRAAEMRAEREPHGPESWPELHEEIGRLPGRYREPVVLCYLEGLSTEAAAMRLGCPKGTVLSRLSRAKDRLRGRLTRRGLAPAMALLDAGRAPLAAIPHDLFTATVRASLSFAGHPAIATGLASTRAVDLARGVNHAMALYRLKVVFAAAMIGALLPGGLWAFGMLGDGGRQEKAAPEAAPGAPGQEEEPSGFRHIDRIDFDQLYVGAIAEAQPRFEFAGARDPGLALKVDVPPFARVKGVRVARRDEGFGGGVACMVTLALDTSSAGKLSGPLRVRLGSQEASVPIVASVKAQEAGRPKVLLISHGFGVESDRAHYYRPWYELVEDTGLDVSYMETDSVPVQQNPDVLPEALKRFDVILLADGVAGLNGNSSQMLVRLAESGKRLIVTASPALESSVMHANRILDPLGMHMDEADLDIGFDPAKGIVPVESARLRTDPLLDGIRRLSALRPAAIEIRDPAKARMLASFPGGRGGFVAVARHGSGEIVAIGMVDLAYWLGDGGRDSDNARFMKNLLTARVGR